MDAAVPIPPQRMVRMLNIRLQLQELQQQHVGLLARTTTRTIARMLVRSPYDQSHARTSHRAIT